MFLQQQNICNHDNRWFSFISKINKNSFFFSRDLRIKGSILTCLRKERRATADLLTSGRSFAILLETGDSNCWSRAKTSCSLFTLKSTSKLEISPSGITASLRHDGHWETSAVIDSCCLVGKQDMMSNCSLFKSKAQRLNLSLKLVPTK